MLIILSIFFVIIFFIDLDHFIIPNELTFPLMIIGFLKSFDPNINLNLFPNYMESLIGGALRLYFNLGYYNFVYENKKERRDGFR